MDPRRCVRTTSCEHKGYRHPHTDEIELEAQVGEFQHCPAHAAAFIVAAAPIWEDFRRLGLRDTCIHLAFHIPDLTPFLLPLPGKLISRTASYP